MPGTSCRQMWPRRLTGPWSADEFLVRDDRRGGAFAVMLPGSACCMLRCRPRAGGDPVLTEAVNLAHAHAHALPYAGKVVRSHAIVGDGGGYWVPACAGTTALGVDPNSQTAWRSQRSAAPVVRVGAGCALFPFSPLKMRGWRSARRRIRKQNAPPGAPPRFLSAPAALSEPSRPSRRLCCRPPSGRRVRRATGVLKTTPSASSSQGLVVAPGGAPAPPECVVCETSPRAPHPVPPSRRLMTAPLGGRDGVDYNPRTGALSSRSGPKSLNAAFVHRSRGGPPRGARRPGFRLRSIRATSYCHARLSTVDSYVAPGGTRPQLTVQL